MKSNFSNANSWCSFQFKKKNSNTHEAPSHSEPSTSVNLRKHHHCRGGNRNEDYRPPVPPHAPHRNIGITANVVRNNV